MSATPHPEAEEPELLPCPFCGTKPDVMVVPGDDVEPDYTGVHCQTPDCPGSGIHRGSTRDERVAWNRRVAVPPPAPAPWYCYECNLGGMGRDGAERHIQEKHPDCEYVLRVAPAAPEREPLKGERPKVVCLCGSSRFVAEMACISWALERDEGAIVLSLHLLPRWYPHTAPDHQAEAEGKKEHFDELHLRKIDLADQVLVVNIGGYIGDSTRREIAYAEAHGKPVRYLESAAERAPVAQPPEETRSPSGEPTP